MKDDRWLVGVPEEHLVQDIEDDGQDEEATESDSNLRRQPELRKLLHQRTRDDRGILKKTHCKSVPGEQGVATRLGARTEDRATE